MQTAKQDPNRALAADVRVKVCSTEGAASEIAAARALRDGTVEVSGEPLPGSFPNASRTISHIRVDLVFWPEGEAVGYPRSVFYSPDDWRSLVALCPNLTRLLVAPEVPAKYQPQAWQRDYAIDIDGAFEFNALPAICKMSFASFLDGVHRRGVDRWDRLADDQPEAREHGGPYEVTPDLEYLWPLLQVHWGEPEVCEDNIEEVGTAQRWDEFRHDLALMCTQRQPPHLPQLPLDLGERFVLTKQPDLAAHAPQMREVLACLVGYLERRIRAEERALAGHALAAVTENRTPERLLETLELLLPRLEEMSQPGDTWPALAARQVLGAANEACWERPLPSGGLQRVTLQGYRLAEKARLHYTARIELVGAKSLFGGGPVEVYASALDEARSALLAAAQRQAETYAEAIAQAAVERPRG